MAGKGAGLDGTYENFSVASLDEAITETKARVKFLVKFTKSSPKTFVTKDSRDVVWKIGKCYTDWKQWRSEIATVLSDEGYPEAAIIIMKNTIGKTTAGKDDGVYKLLRNLFGSTANFSDFKEFRQQLAKAGAIDVVMGYLAQESGKKKDITGAGKAAKTDENDNFMPRCSLQMMLNILKSPTFANDFIKIGAMNTFANLMDDKDEDVKCMASLCLLRLLNSRTPVVKFVDDKNVNLAFTKALVAELKHDILRRAEFRMPVDLLVDGLIFIGQNEANIKKMVQNGVVNAICELLNSSNEATQLRGVELFLALFADRQKFSQTAITTEEFTTIWKKISTMNSSSVETMPVLKAKKVLSNIKQLRTNNDGTNSGAPSDVGQESQSQSPADGSEKSSSNGHKNGHRKSESNETLLQGEDRNNNNNKSSPLAETSFKDNDVVCQLEDAMSETRLRVNFLDKFNHLSPSSLVCPETSKTIELLNDSYSAWDSQWRQKIIQVLLQEKYPELALTYLTHLIKQNTETSSENVAFRMIVNFYLHISNIADAAPECRMALSKAGFIPFLLTYLGKINPVKHPLSSNTSEIVQNTIVLLYNMSRSPELKSQFLDSKDAVNILTKYLNLSNLVLPVSLCLAHVISDTPEAAKMVDEKGVVKNIIELANVAAGEAIRKAYVSGVGLFSLDELMEGLCLLAANDTNKKTIMSSGAVDLISELLGNNNAPAEQIRGMDLMWTLSFEPSVRKEIQSEKDTLMAPLRNLTLSDNAEVKKCAKRTLNFIEKWEKLTTDGKSPSNKDISTKEGGHVFLSYSWKQQDTVLRIKTMLTNKGYRVWMDVDKMHGDLLEKMAQAVENAWVVFVCFSNSYKTSNPCRAEAQYAHILSKPVIPINMEYNYFPDGWLGIMVRAKKFIDMSLEKLPFEESFEQLVFELQALGTELVPVASRNGNRKPSLLADAAAVQQQRSSPPKQQAPADDEKTGSNLSSNISNDSVVAKWTKADVKKWLQQEKLIQKFGPKMEDFDGQKLATLLAIEKTAPEYYYNAVTKHFSETLPNMLQLFAALGRLSASSMES